MNPVLAIELGLEIVVAVIASLAVIRLARRTPSLFANPARTSLILFAALVVTAALLSPAGDLIAPVIGGLAAAVVCAGVYMELRRRRVEAT